MIAKIGRELDKVELKTIQEVPTLELILAIKSILILALQLINVIAIFFSKERKQKIQATIVRLKETQ